MEIGISFSGIVLALALCGHMALGAETSPKEDKISPGIKPQVDNVTPIKEEPPHSDVTGPGITPVKETITPTTSPQTGFQVCGTSGLADDRIKDCRDKLPALTPKIIVNSRTGERFVWNLFSRTKGLKEVWYDQANKLLWSDELSLDTQYNVVARCSAIDSDQEQKGFWPYSWSVPTLKQVEMSSAAGLGNVTVRLRDEYWSTDFFKWILRTKTGQYYPYFYWFSLDTHGRYWRDHDDEGNPNAYPHKGTCVYQFN